MKLSRRRFLGLGAAAVGSTTVMCTGYLAINNEADEPVVDRVQIPIKNLSSALEGFTIAVLADFHLYPYTQLDLVQRSVAMANSLKPDLTVLVGDYVWREVEAIYDLAPVLAGLNAHHGVLTIMGNHDLWTDVRVVSAGLEEVGLPILVNQGIALSVGKDLLNVAGLDDGWSGQPDLNAALDNLPAGPPTILLMHEPDLADTYALDGRVSLQLSGHSHGGQVRLPGIGSFTVPYLGWKYDQGLYAVNDMWLYTNRGIGVTNVPVRYNCPPEITEITLVGV